MDRRRFLRLWTLWSAVYMAIAVVGPNGLIPVPSWPVISQHLIQARAWLGMDIVVFDEAGYPQKTIEVEPRIDVTPYFRTRVVSDPREDGLVSNLAVALPSGTGGSLIPAQDVPGSSRDPRIFNRVMCFVGFPPGPAFLLLPLLVLLRGFLATQWLGALLGGLAVAALDRLLPIWSEAFGLEDASPSRNSLAALAGAGTLLILLAPDGGTFFFAQTVGISGLTVALLSVSTGRRWTAGLAYGLAITSRPAILGALPLLLALHFRYERIRPVRSLVSTTGPGRWRRGAARLAPLFAGPAVFGGITLTLNYLRFSKVTDFGYRFMLVPPFLKDRLRELGQLSLAHFGRNFHWLIWSPPTAVRDEAGRWVFPFLASDPHGMGLFWVTPAFLALGVAWWVRREGRLLAAGWLSLVLCCIPGLLYYNTGWVQWGGRFLMDAWPIWLLLAAIGLRRLPRSVSMTLVVLSLVSCGWGVLLVVFRLWPGCCS